MSQTDPAFQRNAVEAAIRIGGLALLIGWCLVIVRPFLAIIVWAAVMAIAMHPSYAGLKARLGSDRAAASVFALVALLVVLVPTLFLVGSIVNDAHTFGSRFEEGGFTLPPLPSWAASLPAVGPSLETFWAQASADPVGTLGPAVRKGVARAFGAAGNLGKTFVQFVLAYLAAVALMMNAEGGKSASRAIAERLLGQRGPEVADLAVATVRSVARGILGVAVLEGLIAGIGFALLGVPAAGLWGLGVTVFAVVQIPAPILVLVPAIIAFAQGHTATGALALALAVVIAIVDNVLKPVLLGRGVKAPMLVILLGALGGMFSMGIIGLFVGPIVLVVGHTLLLAWMNPEPSPA